MIVFIVILLGFIIGMCGAFYDIYDRHRLEKAIKIEQKNNLIQAEKLRQEKREQLTIELENLQVERELLGSIYVAENINIYGTNDVKKLKKAFALERQIHNLDKKISTYIDKIESL